MVRSGDGLILGKPIADAILEDLAGSIAEFGRLFRPPKLAVVIVGEDPASRVYVGTKVKVAARCGIHSSLVELPESTGQGDLLGLLDSLNADEGTDGILVQMPLPAGIDQQTVIERISPAKDVDGLHPFNLGRLAAGSPRFVPCTPAGIAVLLDAYEVSTRGRHAVVVGRSVLVGKPMALLLAAKGPGGDATVTICHSRTGGLASIVRTADILVAAVGSPRMITGEMVKEGAVVIDVGVNRIDDASAKRGHRLCGDVDFDSVRLRASLITPVPGGVGPMTVAMLMKNTYQAARWALGAGHDGA
ncbi:MAG: bifunctional methylenetetrahydrofolate dehydrogenase/methenyltetrahydrofolate cyclohydrolase FolD [Candidatus Krumholzibacteria bacterium]|nr:bifunctional methylenetetrahydrofolate dehydrogenase/methenyltetrahydrofolate cyclohydrolase FolD [Candidatus Krumholzibacteria bacterium]